MQGVKTITVEIQINIDAEVKLSDLEAELYDHFEDLGVIEYLIVTEVKEENE